MNNTEEKEEVHESYGMAGFLELQEQILHSLGLP
jgi:hypothetical protein